jgi:hypothetical protein
MVVQLSTHVNGGKSETGTELGDSFRRPSEEKQGVGDAGAQIGAIESGPAALSSAL